MKNTISKAILLGLIQFFIFFTFQSVNACSTFQLKKGNEIIYGHNLNEGDIGVPGMIFINKRGIFKTGRTWRELTTRTQSNPSDFCWISRYGSVTFNVFGRDFPDGGVNEVGLSIWEMSETANYPKNDSLPTLNKMNWMQFVLDSYSTIDEVIQSVMDFEIEGDGWHYLAGDAHGNCAVIAFIDGKLVVNRDQTLPIPALFNSPYQRELELLKYYKGFGGIYEPDLADPKVPRFVKTAVMLRDYEPEQNAVEYGLQMLDKLKVNDVPEWSILFDARRGDIYFKTRINPQIKHFSMKAVDFSTDTDVQVLNMDIPEGNDVTAQFSPYSGQKMRSFLESFVMPILPEKFFTAGGLTRDEYLDRFSTHTDAAAAEENKFFKGIWGNNAEGRKKGLIIKLNTRKAAVFGRVYYSQNMGDGYEIEQLQLLGNRLTFTFRTKNKTMIEAKGVIKNNEMNISLWGIEDYLGRYTLIKQAH